jgi:hypothetical protein
MTMCWNNCTTQTKTPKAFNCFEKAKLARATAFTALEIDGNRLGKVGVEIAHFLLR